MRYRFNQLLDVLDKDGQPTGDQARYTGPLMVGERETGKHVVTLCKPAQGCPAIPTAQLRAAREQTGRAVRTRRGQPQEEAEAAA
jgi:hypothetical protein